ncbi:DUF4850 domain-containing protein [Acinetobacter wuhouensis]|nr:DUF4850 domain-containing protein [Acinetobacter wuhouensis]
MKLRKIIKRKTLANHMIASMCVLLSIGYAHAGSEIFKPTFPQYDPSPNIHYAMKIENIGMVQLKRNKVAAVGVAIANPFSDDEKYYRDYDDCKVKSCKLNFDLSDSLSSKFKIVYFPGIGEILAPKDWKIMNADMGPSGVASAMLMSPKQDEAITVYNSSICAGCGMRPATLYFPNLTKESVKNEYGYVCDPHKYLTIVRPRKNLAYFSYQIPNYPNKTHGIAYYYSDGDFNFQEIQVTLKLQNQALATPILNFYQATH